MCGYAQYLSVMRAKSSWNNSFDHTKSTLKLRISKLIDCPSYIYSIVTWKHWKYPHIKRKTQNKEKLYAPRCIVSITVKVWSRKCMYICTKHLIECIWRSLCRYNKFYNMWNLRLHRGYFIWLTPISYCLLGTPSVDKSQSMCVLVWYFCIIPW